MIVASRKSFWNDSVTRIVIEITANGKICINRTTSIDSTVATVVRWGDGTSDTIYGNISLLTHQYSTAGTFIATINNTISEISLYSSTAQERTPLREVYLASGITKLLNSAFANATNLKLVVLSKNLKTIGDNAFNQCTSLTSIFIPNGLTYIDIAAFCKCTNLRTLTIPPTVETISLRNGYNPFEYCTSLRITVDPANPNYKSTSNGMLLTKDGKTIIHGVNDQTVVIPDGVERVEALAFANCTSITSIALPTSLKEIGNDAFYNCNLLASSIEIPNVTYLGVEAFCNCKAIKSMICENLQTVRSSAFSGCTSLSSITINAQTAPTLENNINGIFGSNTSNYTGRATYSQGTNRLRVPQGAVGYDTGLWLDPLCNSTKCGFTLEYIQP